MRSYLCESNSDEVRSIFHFIKLVLPFLERLATGRPSSRMLRHIGAGHFIAGKSRPDGMLMSCTGFTRLVLGRNIEHDAYIFYII